MQRSKGRPDPVSCRSCRSKKLKCNRLQPCSNCTARSIECKFLAPPQHQNASRTYDNSGLLQRIERLESIIREQRASFTVGSHAQKVIPDVSTQQGLRSDTITIPTTQQNQKWELDIGELDNVGIREDFLLARLSNDLVFRIESPHDFVQGGFERVSTARTTISFPEYHIATLLLQNYESEVDPFCNIVHIPTLRSLLKTTYLRLSQNSLIPSGQAALLLAIFAISAYFHRAIDKSELATSKQNAVQISKRFSQSALDVLDHSRRNTSGTLNDIQAYILMSLVAYHLDGYSARYRCLATIALSLARELVLHRLDAPSMAAVSGCEKSVRVLIEQEVKRRVFWHIASTDWLLSTICGPQEGTYLIHPDHVEVNLPKDSTDDDLVVIQEECLLESPQPTGMTFFLERLRLAQLCREICDTIPLETSKLMQLPYENIIDMDMKLQNFMSSLPFFFKPDAESRVKTKSLEIIYPKIPVLRNSIVTEALSRRCKLHQRFLLRQSADPRYSFSRQASLESARAVVRAYEDLREYDSLSTGPEFMGIAIHFTHLALVVMVMDLAFNRNKADEAEIKAEVKGALQIFRDTEHVSPLLKRFLGSLNEALRRYDVSLCEHSAATSATSFEHNDGIRSDPMQYSRFATNMQDPGIPFDASFDDFWQNALQGELNPDLVTWDNLFSAADARPAANDSIFR